MPADLALSALLQDLADVRHRLRGDSAPATFLARLREGVEAWDTAIAGLDAGGDAADALDLVERAFDMEPDFAEDTRLATEMTQLGVATPAHRFLVGLAPIRRDLVRANQRVVTQLRRAVALERRTSSRWRGTEGRAAALVDRDLQLEEVRVLAKTTLDPIVELGERFDTWRLAR
ncbi:hypothetical protein [Actinokineospora sp. NBRC 105648]|uniref:hypothetical protein n=1 Tax=Actinokineospora sp. NBRC 105648 TaxID=3032206 RepID=UPI0024A5A63E|nr:hypothetical protein [Actinokineospora sp. NBRC 105648]GLZ39421.1 hypothetical protein Acsp05_30450 [Actinokineospora sp. NBRC 105648]